MPARAFVDSDATGSERALFELAGLNARKGIC